MFAMPVDDVFYIQRRGVVVTGTITAGTLRVGDQVWVNGRAVVVDAIESFRKQRDEAAVGDTVGVLFKGLTKSDFNRGDVLSSSSFTAADPGPDSGATFQL